MGPSKFAVENRVRLALYRHRGQIDVVVAELKLDRDYVSKIAKKMKGDQKHDVAAWVAGGILHELLIGRSQRLAEAKLDLDALRGEVVSQLSMCCGKAVSQTVIRGKTVSTCSGCKCMCELHDKLNVEAVAERTKLLEFMRVEDEALINYADKQGLLGSGVLGLNESALRPRKYVEGHQLDSGTQESLANLGPSDRERIRRKVENSLHIALLNAAAVDAEETKAEPSNEIKQENQDKIEEVKTIKRIRDPKIKRLS